MAAKRWRERLSSPNWLWRLPPQSGNIALTFDDGPLTDTTPALLRELARLEIPSTHFLVGEQAAAMPDLVRAISDGGHTVANHAYHHESFLLRSAAYQERSIQSAGEAIRRAMGGDCRLYRPCFGQFNVWTQRVLRRLGYSGVLWSLIAKDWIEQTDEDLWLRIRLQLHEGAIIVLHDGHPTTARVIRLLPRLADEVRTRGWTFVPLLPSAANSPGKNT
jgi:peptidoglycan/xylan/chitin deacetylase (PgdA/CDA1 family)